nr:contractile peptide [Mytilus edulis]
GPFGLNKHG